mgnify:CR=1 FL=1
MEELRKISCSDVRLGMRFSAPVFFEDGKNMFLAPLKEAKPYHIFAIKRWKIPFLLTSGRIVPEEELPSISAEGIDGDTLLEDLESVDDISELEIAK